MRKLMIPLLVFTFLLAACASPAALPTATPPADSTVTPSPSFTATLEPTATATQTPTETPAPTAPPEVVRVDDYFGLGPAEITKVKESENRTEEFFNNPDAVDATEFSVSYTNDQGYGGKMENVSFRGIVARYQIDDVKLLNSPEPDLPSETQQITFDIVYKTEDGQMHAITVTRMSYLRVNEEFGDIGTMEKEITIGGEYTISFSVIPPDSNANTKKIIEFVRNNTQTGIKFKDERILGAYQFPTVKIDASGLIKIFNSARYPQTIIDKKITIFGL